MIHLLRSPQRVAVEVNYPVHASPIFSRIFIPRLLTTGGEHDIIMQTANDGIPTW